VGDEPFVERADLAVKDLRPGRKASDRGYQFGEALGVVHPAAAPSARCRSRGTQTRTSRSFLATSFEINGDRTVEVTVRG
jgi:hypothetical protein